MEPLDRSFPLVGIGASAGGLEAISELLAELPATTGMAFLLVQHLDAHHESLLTEILAKKTGLSVETAADGTRVEPGHCYVIPPNTTLTVAGTILRLHCRLSADKPHKPIDILFRSLAEEHGDRAVAVVLSGADSDGAQGIEEIKAAGGIALAQEPTSARFEGMPKNAIATGCIDLVLTPKELGKELVRIGRHPYLRSVSDEPAQEEDGLKRIFRLLRARNGTDFSHYKRSTVRRRLARRMALREVDGLADYEELLGQDSDEIEALTQDFLIRVTSFFRDPETFEGLSETIFSVLFKNRSPKDPLRIWVPGCASGEEVCSIAIVLLEYLGDRANATRVQIFGTDLSDDAIEKARTGLYADSIADEISPARLQRFFVKQDEHYQISKTIRDLCIFARQDVTRDPPFSRIDLVSCRNLLIFLDQTLQQQILQLFHYSLNPGGFLVLGPSETIGSSSEDFQQIGRHKIFRRRPVSVRVLPDFPPVEGTMRPTVPQRTMAADSILIDTGRAQQETDRLLLSRYAPASILIDDRFNIVYLQGETGRYLEHARGAASLNLQKVCRAGLLVELFPAIQEAIKSEMPTHRNGVRVELPGEEGEVSFEVIPVRPPGTDSRYYLIVFGQPSARYTEPLPPGLLVRLWTSLVGAGSAGETDKDNQMARLSRELDATRNYLQATVEEHDAAREEMKSAHEEALSANEEFLSTNEELETAKEELQSTNEELSVTNQELRNRNLELSGLNQELRQSRSYLDSIVETLRESLLVLDGDLRVQKANHEFYETFRARQEDTLQRHLYELGDGQWNIPGLRVLLEGVLPQDRAVRDYEMTHIFPGIGEKTMQLNARRLAGTERRDEMILLAIEDITDRATSHRKLVEADGRKNKFLATLAHELRNPLAPLRIAAQLLRRNAKETGLPQLDVIERQVQKLTRLVDDLLDIARVERDHIELRLERLDLSKVINQAIEATRHHLDDRRQTLSLSLPEKPVRVLADPVRLEQVISNLLNNAAKYTPQGGEIVVSVARRDQQAAITVRDTGIGIAPELLPQLFEMFFQADTSLDRAGGGLGIGLSVTKRLVELHGGRIEGRSEGLGKGSEFIVYLPVGAEAEDERDSAPKEASAPSAALVYHTHRVLIVDDNVDTAETLAEMARHWGHQAAIAHDGPAALKMVPAFGPEIALVDLGLPGMNGYDLVRRLRELPAMKSVPVVAITGYAAEEDRRRAQEVGFNLYFVKPIDLDRLERLLSTLS
jgi:two-component system, chemotaxis family, CheB/CheR fusion protein